MVINYITSYVIPASGILFLLSFIIFFKSLEGKYKAFWYGLSHFIYIIAILFYEQLVLFPFFLMCTLYFVKRYDIQKTIFLSFPSLFISFLYAWILVSRSHAFSHMVLSDLSFFHRVASIAQLISWYMAKLMTLDGIVLIWSAHLVVNHVVLRNFIFLGILFGLSLLIVKYFRRNHKSFAVTWFLIGFLPLWLAAICSTFLGDGH
jgi:hypothetical protein